MKDVDSITVTFLIATLLGIALLLLNDHQKRKLALRHEDQGKKPPRGYSSAIAPSWAKGLFLAVGLSFVEGVSQPVLT